MEFEDTSAVFYVEVVGCFIFLVNWTRSDISYFISMVFQFFKQSGRVYWAAVKRIYRYLKGIFFYGLQYTVSGNQRLEFILYADDDWVADADTRKSLSVYCFLLFSGVMSWSCKKQVFLVFFFIEVKYKVLIDVCKEAEWER